jgi:hypothetical protein
LLQLLKHKEEIYVKTETIGLSKTIFDKTHGFVRVSLSIAENEELNTTIRHLHMKQMEECLKDAERLLSREDEPARDQTIAVAVALFERRASAAFTIQQAALDRKIHELKNGGHREAP